MLNKDIIQEILNNNNPELIVIGTKISVNLGLNGSKKHCFKFKKEHSIGYRGVRKCDFFKYEILEVNKNYLKIVSYIETDTNIRMNKEIYYLPLDEIQYIKVVSRIEEVGSK